MTRQTKNEVFVPIKNLIKRASKDGKVELKRCTKCLMVETNETMTFNEQGLCNICQSFEVREQWDTTAKEAEFGKIIDQYRGKYSYDAIVPFSGGKDSAWVAYVLAKKFKLKVLLAT